MNFAQKVLKKHANKLKSIKLFESNNSTIGSLLHFDIKTLNWNFSCFILFFLTDKKSFKFYLKKKILF